jgi:hypothetical protein
MRSGLSKLTELLARLTPVCDESKYFELKNRLIVFEMKLKKFASECETKFSEQLANTTTPVVNTTSKSITRSAETSRNIANTTRITGESIQREAVNADLKPGVVESKTADSEHESRSDLDEYIQLYTSKVEFEPQHETKRSEETTTKSDQLRHRPRVDAVRSMNWRQAVVGGETVSASVMSCVLPTQQVTVFTKQNKETSNKSTWVGVFSSLFFWFA